MAQYERQSSKITWRNIMYCITLYHDESSNAEHSRQVVNAEVTNQPGFQAAEYSRR